MPYHIPNQKGLAQAVRNRGEVPMKALLRLSLALPFLFVALVPAIPAADDKKDEKMEESEYYPLKIGNVWQYKLGDAKFKLKASKSEEFNSKPSVRVEMLGEGDKVTSFENISVAKDGA